MRLITLLLLTLSLLAAQPLWAAAPQTVDTVVWIYDGDTLKLERLGKVRLLGIDCPEREDSPRDNYYLRKGIERQTLRRVSSEALQYLIRNLKGKRVTLAFDHQERDRHGRLLAYLYLPDGRLLNKVLLEKGLVAVYRKFDFSLKEEFLAAEAVARSSKLGLWSD